MLSRIEKLELLGFEWDRDCHGAFWQDRLSELADYRKVHGHCNVHKSYSEYSKLAHWVARQREQYRFQQQGKKSHLTVPRIKELESLGFEWDVCVRAAWEDRLSELADYRKIHGHCNVPKKYENTKLVHWVSEQRKKYKLQQQGKKSQMTLTRIQQLESLAPVQGDPCPAPPGKTG
jgi:hypothetical protein